MKTLLKGALVGGFIAFVWTNISWMVLPWHGMTISTLPDEAPVAATLQSSVEESGLYILPWAEEHTEEAMNAVNQRMAQGPYAYMVIHPKGMVKSMPKMMLLGLLFDILIALMLSCLLSKTKGLSYIQRVGFVKMAAVAGALVIVIPNIIWWQFPLSYSLVTIIDTGLTWGFAGLGIAKFVDS